MDHMKTILITGATDGIGRQTALDLAKLGHTIILHGRNSERGEKVRNEIAEQSGNSNIDYLNADFTDFKEISSMAEVIKATYKHLDVLINNAGVFEQERVILDNGLERTFMVNHMAVFALSLQLLPQIEQSSQGRLVNVSSMAQAGTMDFDNLNGEKHFDAYNAYALSKLENVLFTYKLHRLLKNTSITTNCLHPGVISTKLLHAGWGSGGDELSKGAKTSVFLAVSNDVNKISGRYFVHQKERKSSAISYDTTIQDRLWEISEEISGIKY